MSAAAAADKAAALLPLHTGAGFVLPNAWDEGSARILEQAGLAAIATTSAGVAADLEAGYGDTAEQVGQTIAAAVSVGVVGALPARSPHR